MIYCENVVNVASLFLKLQRCCVLSSQIVSVRDIDLFFLFFFFFFFFWLEIWCSLDRNYCICVLCSAFFSFFFPHAFQLFQEKRITVRALFITVHALKNIKNGSHGTIHIFKNYFAIDQMVFETQELFLVKRQN